MNWIENLVFLNSGPWSLRDGIVRMWVRSTRMTRSSGVSVLFARIVCLEVVLLSVVGFVLTKVYPAVTIVPS